MQGCPAAAMEPRPTVQYPPDPPVWLQQWPTEGEVRTVFAEGVRRLAYRFLGIERSKILSWTEDRLVLTVGEHVATWRHRESTWLRSCTCGYVNDRCAHAYMAACLFLEIARYEGWIGGQPAPGHARGRQEQGTPEASPRQWQGPLPGTPPPARSS